MTCKHICVECGNVLLPDENHEKRHDPYVEEINGKEKNYGYWCNACYRKAVNEI